MGITHEMTVAALNALVQEGIIDKPMDMDSYFNKLRSAHRVIEAVLNAADKESE